MIVIFFSNLQVLGAGPHGRIDGQDFYDEDILDWPKVRNENWLKDILKNDKSFEFWHKYLERRFNLIDDDWDKPWSFINFINNRLSIYPSKKI